MSEKSVRLTENELDELMDDLQHSSDMEDLYSDLDFEHNSTDLRDIGIDVDRFDRFH